MDKASSAHDAELCLDALAGAADRLYLGWPRFHSPDFSIVSHASMAFAALVGAAERSKHECHLDKTVVGCPWLPA